MKRYKNHVPLINNAKSLKTRTPHPKIGLTGQTRNTTGKTGSVFSETFYIFYTQAIFQLQEEVFVCDIILWVYNSKRCSTVKTSLTSHQLSVFVIKYFLCNTRSCTDTMEFEFVTFMGVLRRRRILFNILYCVS